ncbi:MAG: hypothetical protein PHD37_17700 [Gallionellaceae bacterium]|nr:hypothetical protein [Gallionellaceae bacterium]
MVNKDQLLAVLSQHIGITNGIGVKQLALRLEIEERHVRTLVSDLREDGHAICAHPRTGYFIAQTKEEWAQTRQFIINRSMHGLRWVSRVDKIALPDLLGQLHVPT